MSSKKVRYNANVLLFYRELVLILFLEQNMLLGSVPVLLEPDLGIEQFPIFEAVLQFKLFQEQFRNRINTVASFSHFD